MRPNRKTLALMDRAQEIINKQSCEMSFTLLDGETWANDWEAIVKRSIDAVAGEGASDRVIAHLKSEY